MDEQYFKGVFAAYLGANFVNGPVPEWQMDVIKYDILHFSEAMIDHSRLSCQDKEEIFKG